MKIDICPVTGQVHKYAALVKTPIPGTRSVQVLLSCIDCHRGRQVTVPEDILKQKNIKH